MELGGISAPYKDRGDEKRMIGSGLRKFAAEHGMTVKNGIAYGIYQGYMMTLEEGSGWKSAAFAAHCPDENTQMILRGMLGNPNWAKEYRLQQATVTEAFVRVQFLDNPGTMKRMAAFLEMFCAQMHRHGVEGQALCGVCGQSFDAEPAIDVQVSGVVYRMHEGCAAELARQMQAEYEKKSENGSVGLGSLGALVGALLGSIPWALAYYFGWFVGWLGFLVGIASKKFYELFRGKECKAKGVAIILATIVAILVAEFITLAIGVMIGAGEEGVRIGLGEAILWVAAVIAEDGETQAAVVGDLLLSLLFAGLGIGSTMKGVFNKNRKKNWTVKKL